MADISPPHIERIGDPSTGPRENPSSPQRESEAVAVGRLAPREVPKKVTKIIPKIEPAEEDQHELDELA
jgi:hypothetical protein